MTGQVEISLTSAEILLAGQVGLMRAVQDIKSGFQPRYGHSEEDRCWQDAIEGSLGEMAVSKFLGVYWGALVGIKEMRMEDVGTVGVRTTWRPNGRLILHDGDNDETKMVLVTGSRGKYVLRGWIRCVDGKKQEYVSDPNGGRPAYFVPQSVLRSMHLLTDKIHQDMWSMA